MELTRRYREFLYSFLFKNVSKRKNREREREREKEKKEN